MGTSKKPAVPQGPYVYALADAGEVFYVGKGRGQRMYHHEREARAGKPGAKCDRIRQIWAEGRRVERTVVAEYTTDADAFEAEARLIAASAEKLTNVALGTAPAVSAKERIRKRAEVMLTRLRPMNEWIASLPMDMYESLVRACGSPQEFYAEILDGLKRCIVEPEPNVITFNSDGTRVYGWE